MERKIIWKQIIFFVIHDEPFNYIDVFSRMQIEKLIETYDFTMLFVEHDSRFCEKIATKIVDM
jgi:lincosamide and streptogramin A transport system ATP-binding/permease protein